MFGSMRRKDRELPRDTAMHILENGKYGVMSVICENGYPYGVPIHYVMMEGKIYFHGTCKGGMKTEAINQCSNISFTVIEPLEGVRCQSSIVFGKVRAVPAMRSAVLEQFVEKFVPAVAWEQAKSGIPHALESMQVYEITMEHLSAKVINKPEGR